MAQIKVDGTANLAQMKAQFASVTAQVEQMNAALARASMIPQGGSPAKFAQIARAGNAVTASYNNALASSGAFRVEQIKINDAVNTGTELLQRHKLAFNQVFGKKSKKMMQDIYREQLAMQNMQTRMVQGAVGDGRVRMSLAIPTGVHESWDTLNNRIGMFRYRLASASAELINWGKNTQWAGRQLMVGFTLPVAAFGAAAAVTAYQVDKQLTRIQKVYDTTADANIKSMEEQAKVTKELEEVRAAGLKTAQYAAHEYGSSITDTLEVQAELAATGQTGARLQESTNQVMRIATLGEIEHADATKALISLQSILGHTVKETADDFNYMNSIENATSLSTNDFVAAIPRALGPMKEMGGSLQDLAILMVAMKERGVEAGEGANAIKAMMQRLYRPSVQVREEWQQIAKVDPLQFVKEADGNVMEILPRIAEATKDLDKASRVKLLAGLFGTYQVTRMSAMLDGLSDMEQGIGQTTRVLEVNEQSWQDWGDTAERELTKQAESISGKFKRAYEGLRAELAEIGEPFLEVATFIVKAVSRILELFNMMPGAAKKILIFAAIAGAIVGPVVMLIGLFANFAGNIGKFGASLLRFASSWEIVTKSQWASRQAAKASETAMVQNARAAEVMEAQLKGLTIAAEQSAVAMSRLAGIPLPAGIASAVAARNATGVHHGPQMVGANTAATAGYMSSMWDKSQGRYRDPDTKRYMSAQTAEMKAQAKLAADHMQSSNLIARNADATAVATQKSRAQQEATSKITKTTASNMNGMAVSMGTMAVASGVLMFTSNETAGNIAQWALALSFIIPGVKGLALAMGTAGKAAWGIASAHWASAAASRASAAGTFKAAGAARALGAGAKGAALGFASMMGPVGWVTAGLVGAGALLYKLHKDAEESLKEQIKLQKSLNSTTDEWAKILEVNERKRKSLPGLGDYTAGGEVYDIGAMADEFASSESGKPIIQAFTADDVTATEQNRLALSQYLAVLRETDASVKDAQLALEIFYTATGADALEAKEKAAAFANEFGSFDISDMSRYWAVEFKSVLEGSDDVAATAGNEMGKILADSIASAATAAGRDRALDAYMGSLSAQWGDLMDDLDSTTQTTLANLGVNASNFSTFFTDLQEGGEDFFQKWNMDDLSLEDQMSVMNEMQTLMAVRGVDAEKLQKAEAATVKLLMADRNIVGDITTMEELRATWAWRVMNATKKNAKALYNERLAQLNLVNTLANGYGGFLGVNQEVTQEQRLQALNVVRSAMGMERATSLAQGFKNEAADAADETGKIARNLSGIGNIDISIKADQVGGILQSAMQGVQEEIADARMSAFESSMDAAVDANAESWDNRTEALADAQEAATERMENRHEVAMDRFEARWERRREQVEKSYDVRIDRINAEIEAEQKAEEIRQRIFEAEQSRLDRLSESFNRTIDFNIALQTGDLDEAAKIRNDMDAAAQSWALSDAAAAGARGSERRQERLGERADKLEDQKDAALEALEAREEAERESLERRQEMEKKHLEKIQEMNSEALAEQAENAKDAYQQSWEYRKDGLERELATFKAFVPKNMKQLEAWMKEMGISYEQFGDKTLNPKAQKWGKWFKQSLKENIREAGLEIASSNQWEGMGAGAAKKTLKGMGFGSLEQFERFLKTGRLPTNFVETSQDAERRANAQKYPHEPTGHGTFRHEGGYVDGGMGSRKGVPRTMGGLHRSEMNITAQRGEFLVNRDSAKKYGDALNAINKGIYDQKVMGGAAPGPVGLVAAGMGTMFAKGVSNTFRRAARAGQSVASGVAAGYSMGVGGRHRPVNGGTPGSIHDAETGFPAVDLAVPTGTPIFAVADGRITRSEDITGYEPFRAANGRPQDGYRSYGKVIQLATQMGEVLYAHLSKRFVALGKMVKGGSVLGLSGDTGKSTGPHLHFGATNGPLAWLKQGGMTLNDGIAALHRGETVLTEPLSRDLKDAIKGMGEGARKRRRRGIDPSEANMWGPETTKVTGTSASAFWTWLNQPSILKRIAKIDSKAADAITDTGAKALIRIGALNTHVGTGAASTQSDLKKLIGKTDFLALTEMKNKFYAIQKWLADRGWGLLGGTGSKDSRSTGLAYNKHTQMMEKSGIRQLGKKTADFEGGRTLRYAPYGLFKDKKSGRKTWQVAAHTVPTPRFNKTRRELFFEQWGNLDRLVNDLQAGGAPVFVAGDLNNRPDRDWWRTPGGLNEYRGHAVDWIFGDKKLSRAVSSSLIKGLHTDHAGAVLANYSIPSARKGAGDIRWDNTLVNLHKKESVLTADQSNNFRYLADNLDKIAMGAGTVYDIDVIVPDSNASPEAIAKAVKLEMKKEDARKPQPRRRK